MNTKNFAIAALALGIVPDANAGDKGCSNLTLKGSFSDKDSGWIYTSPTAAPLAFAGVNANVQEDSVTKQSGNLLTRNSKERLWPCSQAK